MLVSFHAGLYVKLNYPVKPFKNIDSLKWIRRIFFKKSDLSKAFDKTVERDFKTNKHLKETDQVLQNKRNVLKVINELSI